MKKIIYSLFLFASLSVFAQKDPGAKFAVANGNVGTVAMFDLHKKGVQSVNVYKNTAALPQNLQKFSFLADNGLANVTLRNDYGTPDFISLAELNRQNGISVETPVFIDGYEFADTKTNIFADLVSKVEIKSNNGKKTLYITSIKK